ncbi:MAG: 30S ribosomal protein S8, partial [Phascolarctobacterium sp.]|nr:30S ribosomal protein S8 [Phascolarctobacterium sp.]
NMKKAIVQILLDEGYIKSFTVIEDGKQGVIRIVLKYTAGKTPVITGLRRVSKPGLRKQDFYNLCVNNIGYNYSIHFLKLLNPQSIPPQLSNSRTAFVVPQLQRVNAFAILL